jgi:CheY-like chemotaxis protein
MKNKSILVIERDHEARVLIRRALEDRGHFVISATSGAEAIVLLEKMSIPTLILINPQLNYMDPQGFIQLIRRMPGFEKIPIGQIGIAEKPLAEISCMADTADLSPILNFLEA